MAPEKSRSRLLSVHFIGLAITWAIVVVGLLSWDLYKIRQTERKMAGNEARAHFNKDQELLLWTAYFGGVYVPVTERTEPNPYLSHLPERDVRSPSGRLLTLMNPASMIRRVMDEYAGLYGIRGHITSLRPTRVKTAPDRWEVYALGQFDKGGEEVSEFTQIEAEPYLRLMRPIYAGKDCLPCHAEQGYRAGDIIGGISISVPMAPYIEAARRQMTFHGALFGVLLFTGLAVIGFTGRSFIREMRERDQAELDLRAARDSLEERTAELKKANMQVMRHASQLEKLNVELEEFASIASHDLREPLRKIRGFGDLLSRKWSDCLGDEGRDYLMRITNASRRMGELIDALAGYSRVTTCANPFLPVDLHRVVRDVASDLEFCIKRNDGRIEVGELPTIMADEAQMRQLFQNLVANALKYQPEGNKPFIRIYATTEDENCRIYVEDNGIGFEQEHAERIFKPMERLHGRSGLYPGTGMGLAICKKIADRHGGSITATSAPGRGSTFVICLPAGLDSRKTDL